MAKRQLIIMNASGESSSSSSGEMEPLGDRRDVYRQLSRFNTNPEVADGEFLWGPGLMVQAPMTGADEINQLLLILTDEDFAWPVVNRMCKECGWKLVDPESGRVLTF